MSEEKKEPVIIQIEINGNKHYVNREVFRHIQEVCKERNTYAELLNSFTQNIIKLCKNNGAKIN